MAVDQKDAPDPKSFARQSGLATSGTAMMRIAIAGTGGLARLIAYYIEQQTSHQVILLSRRQQLELTKSHQVAVVDYSNAQSLQYALKGIDTVISTFTGPNQIELIKAAVRARVRRFAPAEFENSPSSHIDDPNDNKSTARHWLAYYSQNIQSTSFVCGILYERFQPGGLAASRMGHASGCSDEGDYIINCRTMAAQIPFYDSNNAPSVTICLTSVHDVAKFVTRALDLPHWPPEMRMCGQRLIVRDLVLFIQQVRGRPFNPVTWHNAESLRSELRLASLQEDAERQRKLNALIATTEGRYDFREPNLNQLFPDIKPISFQDWFVAKWRGQ